MAEGYLTPSYGVNSTVPVLSRVPLSKVIPAMHKVYAADISANHVPIVEATVGRHSFQGAKWLRHIFLGPFCVPGSFIRLYLVLLIALNSPKRVGDLQTLSVAFSCIEFAPGMVKAILHPRRDYIP